jgi:hypothetical protein
MQIGAAGFAATATKGETGCTAFALAPGLVAEVTSSGNDPVCSDANTSQIRLTFGQNS